MSEITKELLHDLEAAYELGFGPDFMAGRPEKRKTFLAIRALIESGVAMKHPLSKLAENMIDMTPAQHKAADDCLKELIHNTTAPLPEVEEAMPEYHVHSPEDLLQEFDQMTHNCRHDMDLSLDSCQGCLGYYGNEKLRTVLKAALSKSAPSSEEREEMVRLVDLTIHMEMEGYFGNGQADEQDKEIIRIVKLWQKLRALILAPPIRVTGKDIGDLCLKLLACPFNDVKDTFVEWFHEKGIEVET